MDILDKVIEFAEEHPYTTALGIIGCAIGFIIDKNLKDKEEEE